MDELLIICCKQVVCVSQEHMKCSLAPDKDIFSIYYWMSLKYSILLKKWSQIADFDALFFKIFQAGTFSTLFFFCTYTSHITFRFVFYSDVIHMSCNALSFRNFFLYQSHTVCKKTFKDAEFFWEGFGNSHSLQAFLFNNLSLNNL